jgi:hypothetical protein
MFQPVPNPKLLGNKRILPGARAPVKRTDLLVLRVYCRRIAVKPSASDTELGPHVPADAKMDRGGAL